MTAVEMRLVTSIANARSGFYSSSENILNVNVTKLSNFCFQVPIFRLKVFKKCSKLSVIQCSHPDEVLAVTYTTLPAV